jgi:hypothetical protein
MIRLDTFRALHEHDHQLAAYCATCERWAVLDLERLIADLSPSRRQAEFGQEFRSSHGSIVDSDMGR